MPSLRLDGIKVNLGNLSPDGYLLGTNTPVARVGVQIYKNPDGSERKEFRPPEEVGKGSSLKAFELLPVTFEHPPILLNSAIVAKYQVGTTGENATFDGKYVRVAKIKILDEKAIGRILDDEIRFLSVGYICDIENTPGTYEGEEYHGIQRNIRPNHIAITKTPRGGKELEIRFDSENKVIDVAYSTFEEKEVNMDQQMSLFDLEEDELNDKSKAELIQEIKTLKNELSSVLAERNDAYELMGNLEAGLIGDRNAQEQYISERYRIEELQTRNDSLFQDNENLKNLIERQKQNVSTAEEKVRALEERQKQEIQQRCDSYISTVMSCMKPVGKGVWQAMVPDSYLLNPDVTMSPSSIMRLAIQHTAGESSEIARKVQQMSDEQVPGAFSMWKAVETSENGQYDVDLRSSVSSIRQDSSGSYEV